MSAKNCNKEYALSKGLARTDRRGKIMWAKFWKEHPVFERAAKTFVETFIATFCASISFGFATAGEAKAYYVSLAGSALAAGLSAAWNAMRNEVSE